jgi:RNA polymerase sigma factor (sigma-70 family)
MSVCQAVRQIQTLYTSGAVGGLTDAELVDRYLCRHGTEREDAFTVLVQRHGPMVLRVCRRMLGGSADAEDSFQAVFLILARRAGGIRRTEWLASWLYGVAIRVSQQARRQSARRRAREERAMATVRTASSPDPESLDLSALLDEEIKRLPARYREAVLLCELEGLSRRDAAERLGLAEGTLSSRLGRGRSLLRERLLRRGVAPGVVVAGSWMAAPVDAAPTGPLVYATVTHALEFAAGGRAVPLAVASLARGVLAMIVVSKLKLGAMTVLAVAALAALTAGLARAGNPRDGEAAKAAPKAGEQPRQEPKADRAPAVRGTVVDERGRPVAGADVRVQAYSVLETSRVTVADGTFALPMRRPRIFGLDVLARSAEGDRVGTFRYGYDLAHGAAEAPIRIVLKPHREIVVRVVDSADAPIAGAAVEVAGNFAIFDDAVTGPEGAARLRAPVDEKVEWILGLKSGQGFDYAEYGRSDRHGRNDAGVPAAELPGSVTLRLDQARTVRIRALDRSGQPLAGFGFHPWLLGREGRSEVNLASARFVSKTGPDGTATFDWLPPAKGRGLLQFWPVDEGYANRRVIVEEEETKPVTARMVQTETLRGRVTRPDGSPAPGIEVVANGTGKGMDNGYNVARTAADGSYAMELSPDEAYAVYVDDKDWAARTRLDVVVLQGKPVAGVDFRLTRGTVIRGTVTIGAEARPADNRYIWLDESAGKQAPDEVREKGERTWREVRRQFGVSTDAEGHYALRVGPGTFGLNGPARTEPEKITVTDQTEIVRDFSMPRPEKGPISGRIVVDQGGYKGVGGAKVEIMAMNQRGFPFTIFADANGRFEAERDLDPLLVCAHSPDGSLGAMFEVGEEDPEVVIVLAPTATATGVLVDETGKPAAKQPLAWGRRVYLNKENQISTLCFVPKVVTDAEGRFTLPSLVVGEEYSVSVERDGVYLPVKSVRPEKGGAIDLGQLKVGESKPRK